MLTETQNPVEIKAYTLKELASIYDVCPRTLKRWMMPFQNEIGTKNGRFYTIPQVRVIFSNLSLPATAEAEELV